MIKSYKMWILIQSTWKWTILLIDTIFLLGLAKQKSASFDELNIKRVQKNSQNARVMSNL